MLRHGEAKPLKESSLHLFLQNCGSWVLNFLLLPITVVNLGLSGFLPPKQVISEEGCTEKPTRGRQPSKPWAFSQSEKFLHGGIHICSLALLIPVFFFQSFTASVTPSPYFISLISNLPSKLVTLERYLPLLSCWYFWYDTSFAHCWLCFVQFDCKHSSEPVVITMQ